MGQGTNMCLGGIPLRDGLEFFSEGCFGFRFVQTSLNGWEDWNEVWVKGSEEHVNFEWSQKNV